MIYDSVRNLPKYRGLNPTLDRAISYVAANDLNALAIGRHDIAGDELFAVVHEYQSKQPSAARWEAHRKYVDLQIILAGAERMDVADVGGLAISEPYNDATDNAFFATPANSQLLRVSAGEFAIFLTHDAHAPTIMIEKPVTVRKIVFKIRAW